MIPYQSPGLTSNIYLGAFNAERYWQPDDLSLLPSIPDPVANKIISVTDEVQFVFSENEHDIVFSRLKMDKTHVEYIRDIGFKFNNAYIYDNIDEWDADKDDWCISQLILENDNAFKAIYSQPGTYQISPYAVNKWVNKLNNDFSGNPLPDENVVKKVNSKYYSWQLTKKICKAQRGEIVFSSSDMIKIGSEMLHNGPFIIKELYGVSGKGNILINNMVYLNRIANYIQKQEDNVKRTALLLEPYLQKKTDFSCQLEIKQDGTYRIISFQKMENKGNAFHAIVNADLPLLSAIHNSDYIYYVERIAGELFKEGYHGPVCIDSMITHDDQIIPVIEINARKSMGLINTVIKNNFDHEQINSKLIVYNLAIPVQITFKQIFHQLCQHNLLFGTDRMSGIIPLTANTIDIVSPEPGEDMRRGRIYISVVSKEMRQEEFFLTLFRESLNTIGINFL